MPVDLKQITGSTDSLNDMGKYDYLLLTVVALASGFLAGVHKYVLFGVELLGGNVTIQGVTLSISALIIIGVSVIAVGKYKTDFDKMFKQRLPMIYLASVYGSFVFFIFNPQFSAWVTGSYVVGVGYTVFIVSGYVLLFKYQQNNTSGKLRNLI